MNDSTELARVQPGGALATDSPVDPWRGLELLKPHGGLQRPVRTEFLGTISAGYRNADGVPVISRDGTIFLTDPGETAAGLAEELKRRGGKALTVAFGSDKPHEVIHQSFKRYSRTRLEAHGNAEEITEIVILPGQERAKAGSVLKTERRTVRKADDPAGYAALAATCKAETFCYFYLARWTPEGKPEIYLPDGWGCYRLRFTSLNSAESLRNTLSFIATHTGGKIAGIPLELFLTMRELAGPDGTTRRVPVWTALLQPPEMPGLQSAGAIRGILTAGIEQAASLSLPAPVRIQTLEEAAAELPDVDLEAGTLEWTDGEVRELSEDDAAKFRAGGGIGNFERFRAEYFLAAGHSTLRSDEGRADFLRHWTGGRTDSLREYASFATARNADEFLAEVGRRAVLEIEARNERGEPTPPRQTAPSARTRGYAELYPDEEADSGPPAAVRPRSRPTYRPAPDSAVAAAVAATGGPSVPVVQGEIMADVDDDDARAELAATLAAERLAAERGDGQAEADEDDDTDPFA